MNDVNHANGLKGLNGLSTAPGDPVADHVATLSATLHGPVGAKSRMIQEIRDGLTDTVEAHTRDGLPYDEAARLAVREFGSPRSWRPAASGS